MENLLEKNQITFTPEKCKQIALARLDVVYKWLEFRKKSQNKLQADYDFVKLHNTSNSHLFEILGKISRGSLHRWFAMLNGTVDYEPLSSLYPPTIFLPKSKRKAIPFSPLASIVAPLFILIVWFFPHVAARPILLRPVVSILYPLSRV